MTLHGGREHGISRRRAGIIGIVVICVLVYFAFTKDIPFTNGYRVNAYFSNAMNIQPKSPVRIAGVNVGKVASVERREGSAQTKVVLQLDDEALPIHANATAKIRPRIFLEGNNQVELNPGTPNTPEIKDGGTIPVAQTGNAVQLDQLLAAVDSNAREGLTSIFTEIGTALNTKGTAEENADQDEDVKDLTGAQALNRAFRYGEVGFRGGAKTFDALIGYGVDDQLTILRGFRDFNSAINDREAQIVPLIRDFATTIGAFADDEEALRQATLQFSRLAYESEPALRQMNALFPQLTKWANTIAPQLKEIPATADAAYPWIDETNKLLSKDELGGIAKPAQRTVENFAKTQAASLKLFPQLDRVSRCWNDNWWPTLQEPLDDGAHSSGKANYKEFWYSLVGWNSSAQNFSANGPLVRFGAGSAVRQTSPSGALSGNAALPQTGVNPALPAKAPPIRSDIDCYKNPRPNMAPTPGSIR